MVKLHGVLGPVVTTFQSAVGDVDRVAFANNVRAHIQAGLHGIVVTGSTGEAALLDEQERAQLVEAARAEIPSDRLLLVGTGAESTRTCLRLTRQAAERGASAVLVVAPHYYGSAMSAEALSTHYRRIADESPVPVVLYNIPKYMHFSIAPTLVTELATHGNVIGIKDSSGDLALISAYINAQSERFSVLTGSATTAQGALEAGARGGILAAGLFAPELSLDLYAAVARGDKATATALQARLKPLGARVVGEMGVAGVKAAMDQVGLRGGPVRSPLLPLPNAGVAEVAQLLREAQLSLAA